jgi:hypothetical protein
MNGKQWFDSLSPDQQKQYLKLHPHSKLNPSGPKFGANWESHLAHGDVGHHISHAAEHKLQAHKYRTEIDADPSIQAAKQMVSTHTPGSPEHYRATNHWIGMRSAHPKYGKLLLHNQWAAKHDMMVDKLSGK